MNYDPDTFHAARCGALQSAISRASVALVGASHDCPHVREARRILAAEIAEQRAADERRRRALREAADRSDRLIDDMLAQLWSEGMEAGEREAA